MARIRTIKPEFFSSEDIVSLSPMARLLYIALWCEADREGRFTWKPNTFKLRYLAGDNCDIQALCSELTTLGVVVLYGDGLAWIPQFSKHQHVNPRESKSTLPNPEDEPNTSRNDASISDLNPQVGRERKGKEGEGKEGNPYSVPNGTGGEPPSPPPAPPSESPKPAKMLSPAEAEKSRLWAWVKTTLVKQKTSADMKAAGNLAGKLAAKYGADVFADAARAAMAAPPVDLHTYLVALCETAVGKRVPLGRTGPLTDEQREAANAAETQKAKDLYRQRYPGSAGGDVIDAEATFIEQPILEGPAS